MYKQSDIINQFKDWFDEAKNNKNILEPTAMCLASVDGAGKPSARFVLLKYVLDEGFVFVSNYESRKAHDFEANNNVAFTMHWEQLEKQIRVEGVIKKASAEISDEYFNSRKRGSQIGAWASIQSEELKDYKELKDRIKHFEEKFDGQDVPRPENWGAYLIEPSRVEFWAQLEFRLHKREVFEKLGDNWTKTLLYP